MADKPLWMQDQVKTVAGLREFVEEPHEMIVKKTVSIIDSHVENYLSKASLFFLATSDENSRTDVSPRGDAAGFVRVLDERTLAFPDRPGNKRTDSLLNILQNPQVGMLFVIPGMDGVLRINGRAHITRNEEFIAGQQWEGKTTGLAVVVETEEAFIHCPRAFKQGGLWNSEKWLPQEEHPSSIEMYKAHLRLNGIEA